MSIKAKLTLILVLIGLVLAILTGFFFGNAYRISQQIRIVNPAIEHLNEIGETNADVYEQIHALVHYFLLDEAGSLEEFEALKLAIKRNFPKLAMKIEQHRKVQSDKEEIEKERRELNHLALIEKDYDVLMDAVDQAVFLHKSGRQAKARRLMGDTIEEQFEDFLTKIERTVLDKAEEISGAQDELLTRLGGTPWAITANKKLLLGSRLSIDYFLNVGRLSRAMNRQVNEVVEYLMRGDERDRMDFYEAGFQVEEALQKCRYNIQAQIQLEMEGEKEQLEALNNLEHEYLTILKTEKRVIALRNSGKIREALSLLTSSLKPRVDESFLPRIKNILHGSRKEIAEAHQSILYSAFLAAITGAIAICIVSLALFLVSKRLTGGILASIQRIKTGTEIIGKGDLDYRIQAVGKDELGDLAAAFNAMTQSLKENDQELKSFVYGLSHDLRTPLVNLKGFSSELAHLLKELEEISARSVRSAGEADRGRLQQILHEEIPNAAGFISSGTDKMGTLVNALLKLARAGRMPFSPELTNMADLVQEVLKHFADVIKRENIKVMPGILPSVRADKAAMEQVMRNLIDNAIKYRRPGLASVIEIYSERHPEETIFHVRDNGRGISAEDSQKVFQFFRRAGEQDVPGEGMGLLYARAIIRRHGGRIWFESNAAGTTFSFSVPTRALYEKEEASA